MLIIAESGRAADDRWVGPEGTGARRVAQRDAESARSFAERVRDVSVGDGVVVYAGAPAFDADVQSARLATLTRLSRSLGDGRELWIDCTGLRGPSRHSLVALADALSAVAPHHGVRLVDRPLERPRPSEARPAARRLVRVA